MNDQPTITDPNWPGRRGPLLWRLGLAIAAVVVTCWVYVATHPLVFNESFISHAHCITQAGLSLRQYSVEHYGKFPFHTNGYGDALLLLIRDKYTNSDPLTGAGYESSVFDRALTNDTDVPESECGRVYIQGLTESSNPEIVLLFDKLPTPGGDHCHGLARLTAHLCREVALVDGSHQRIREADWPEFSRKQVQLLMKEGFSREQAEIIYREKPKRK
jgi:hypothetical protein